MSVSQDCLVQYGAPGCKQKEGATVQTPLHSPLANELAQLGSRLDGTLTINDPGRPICPPVWNELLKSANPLIARPADPLCYVACASRHDVRKCVAFAVGHRLKVYARGSGHHYSGACLADGGMVLDLSRLKRISIDPDTRTATIEPGVTTREIRTATIQHGLHFPAGHISDVGCSGFILGGGNGWGVTKYGAAADNVLGFTAVLPRHHPHSSCDVQSEQTPLADSQAAGEAAPEVYVDETSDLDLFAGLKGAGAFLGIVVEFKLQLHPVERELPVITAVYPVSCAPQVVALHAELLAAGPSSVEPSVAFIQGAQSPHEGLVILGVTAFAASDDAGVCAAYDKVRSLLPASRLSLQDCSMPYLEALSILDEAWNWPGLCCYAHGMFVEQGALTPELIQGLMSATAAMSSHKSLILLVPAAPITQQASSLDFRGGLFLCAYAMWPRTAAGSAQDGDEAHAAWVHGVKELVGQAAVGLYFNEVMLDQPGNLGQCYKSATLERLLKLKAATDPFGLLRPLHC